MYKNVAERGPWGSLFIDAFQAFKPREFSDSALIRYMLLAELGYEMGISNAAFILDRGSPLLIFSFILNWHVISHFANLYSSLHFLAMHSCAFPSCYYRASIIHSI